jgi:hypothetical protein
MALVIFSVLNFLNINLETEIGWKILIAMLGDDVTT